MQVGADGNFKIRTSIVVFEKAMATVVCKHCKSAVLVDIHLGEKLQKALTPRLVLKKVPWTPSLPKTS